MRLRRLAAKVDVGPIVVDHFSTLRDAARGRLSVGDWVVLLGLPLGVAAALWSVGVRMAHPATIAGGVGVFAGLLFALLVLAFDMAVRASSEARTTGPSRDTRARAAVISELGANVAYCILVTLLLAALLLGSALGVPVERGEAATVPAWASAAIGFVAMHLGMTLLMVLKRVYRVMQAELRTAATGSAPKP